MRLTKQSARMRVSHVVEPENIARARRMDHAGYARIATNEKGELDTDCLSDANVAAGEPVLQEARYRGDAPRRVSLDE